MPFTQSLTVTLLERILDGWSMLLLFWVGLALAPVGGIMVQTAYIAGCGFRGGEYRNTDAVDSTGQHLTICIWHCGKNSSDMAGLDAAIRSLNSQRCKLSA